MLSGAREILFAIALTIVMSSPARAWADEPEETAAKLFREGSSAYDARDFARAADLFEAAHRAAPRAATILSAALARETAGQPARAADDYETALQLGLDDARAKDARARLAALNKIVGTLSVTAPIGGTVSVAHAVRAPIPSRIHVDPGNVEVRIERRDGSVEARNVDVPPGQTTTLAIEDAPAPLPPRVEPRPPPALAPPIPPVSAPRPSSSSARTIGFISLGASVALAGVAVGLGVATLNARSDYAATGFTDSDLRDRTLGRRAWTNVAAGGAVLTGAVGLIALIVAPKRYSAGAPP